MTEQTPEKRGVWALSREEQWALVSSLLQRSEPWQDAKEVFQRRYPTAPPEMIQSAVFHLYVDGTDAAIRWLAETELLLRDPNHRPCAGVTSELLNHIYNWHQFQLLLPEGRPELLALVKQLNELADEADIEGVKSTAQQIKDMFDANLTHPDFEPR